MPRLLLDTHAAVWFLRTPDKLGRTAATAIDNALARNVVLLVSAISLVEIRYLGEKGRIPADSTEKLLEILTQNSSFQIVPVDSAVASVLGQVPRADIPDMPDRIIAATALLLKIPLITCDGKITSSKIETIW